MARTSLDPGRARPARPFLRRLWFATVSSASETPGGPASEDDSWRPGDRRLHSHAAPGNAGTGQWAWAWRRCRPPQSLRRMSLSSGVPALSPKHRRCSLVWRPGFKQRTRSKRWRWCWRGKGRSFARVPSLDCCLNTIYAAGSCSSVVPANIFQEFIGPPRRCAPTRLRRQRFATLRAA